MLGIKTLAKKTIFFPSFLFSKLSAEKFPRRPISSLSLKARIFALKSELKERKKHTNIGNLLIYPLPVAVRAWRRLLSYNPNNLGNWSLQDQFPKELFGTRLFEREMIFKMVDLYQAGRKGLEGYFTSGGTEGNLFSAWLGRKFLEKKIEKEKICLIKTDLSHYSIEKVADIVNIPVFVTPLNRENWTLDVRGLAETVDHLYQKGFRGFLLPLTFGYTLTGTNDPYEKICLKIRKLRKSLKKAEFFVWLDAALNGLIEPFLNKRFLPFNCKEIQTFLVDFHKFGFAPYPSGIVLYRRNLRKYLERPIDYLEEKDNTVLGSRSGISAVSSWAVIHHLGKEGFRRIIKKCLLDKEEFIRKAKTIWPKAEIVSSPRSVNLGVVFKNFRLSRSIERRYGLYPARLKISFFNGREEKKTMYKLFFLPHFKRKIIKDFFKEVSDGEKPQ